MIVALALAAAAAAPTVVDADRAFAQMAQDKGQWTAFRTTATPDAIWFRSRPSEVQDDLKDARNPAKSVAWWPTQAWQSCDGTMGVTTGGAIWPDGHASRYTTIWRRQADGGWKWVYDNGETIAAPLPKTRVKVTRASCLSYTEPMVFPRVAGVEQGAGGSKDGSLVFWWTVAADGKHQLKVHLWDGTASVLAHERDISMPPAQPMPKSQ